MYRCYMVLVPGATVAKGPDEERWWQLAEKLHISDRIDWIFRQAHYGGPNSSSGLW